MPDLIIQSGKHRGRKLVLPEAEIFIGRDEDCQIRLASNDISRRHCRLTCRADTILVRDLGSRNGTFVNNMLIDSEVALKPGDSLRVGPITLQMPVRRGPAPGAAATPKKGRPLRTQPSALDSASDDDIASWLSDESLNDGGSTGDTTIVSRSEAAAAAQAAAAAETEESPATAPSPDSPAASSLKAASSKKKKSQSVADEAADIIRRHWEQVKQQKGK